MLSLEMMSVKIQELSTCTPAVPKAAEEELRQARRPDGGSVELLQEIRHRRSQCTSSGDHFVLHVLDLMTHCWHTFPELRVSSANAAKILRDSAK